MYRLRAQLINPIPDGTGNTGFIKSTLAIVPFPPPPPDQAEPELLVGWVHGKGPINVELLKTWMRCYDAWHAGECKTSFRATLVHPAAEFTVYGIDVHNLQLRTLAAGDRYYALSYVWGQKPFYRLLTEDVP
jgi:hypothetical protein